MKITVFPNVLSTLDKTGDAQHLKCVKKKVVADVSGRSANSHSLFGGQFGSSCQHFKCSCFNKPFHFNLPYRYTHMHKGTCTFYELQQCLHKSKTGNDPKTCE